MRENRSLAATPRTPGSPTGPEERAGFSWDFRRGTAAARVYGEVAGERGIPLDACLEGSGIARADLDDPDAEIEASQELVVVRNLLGLLGGEPGLGVEAGRRFNLASYGILGFALLSSPTLRDAAIIGIRYIALTFAFVRPSLEEEGGDARLVWDDREIPEDARPFLVERDITAIAVIMWTLLGREVDFRLETRLDGAHGRALAALLPGREVRLGTERNLARFDRRLLDEPLPQADEQTARMCERQCQELLDRRRRRRGVAAQVRSRLLRRPGDLPSMEIVAGELHLDPRTLRRHLAREGTSFRDLVDEVRETLAVELLATWGLTVDEIATRLGYSEAASFTHAFKRWRGVPPSAYRSRR